MPKTAPTTFHTILTISAAIALGALSLTFANKANAAPPDLSGTYQCQPNPLPCLWTGQTPSISQTGSDLQIKNDKGVIAAAKLTSDITISAGGPLNSYGIIRDDHSIDWSNGNIWRRQ
jgi:hypothetical protein